MKLLAALFLVFLSSVAFGAPAQELPGQVWKVGDHRWTVQDEVEFGIWVEANLTEDFFIRHKIPIDCADVPYAARWIYARIAHLPTAATTRDGQRVGHWSIQWGHLPTHPEWHKDLRFRAALLHVLSETTTRTLPLDTYPVRITLDSITPGTLFLITESHAGIIGHVVLDGSQAHPLQTWEATVPARVQKMSQKSFLSPRPESTIFSGLVKFRWPVGENGRWKYGAVKEHPFYSEEQYSSSFYEGHGDFVGAVAQRIDPTPYDPWEKMINVTHTINRLLQDRFPIVLAGYERCHKGGCPEGSDLWEIHSTPGRDGMIILLMDHLKHLIESNHLDPGAVQERIESILIPINRDRSVTLHHLYQNYLWLSPHPEDSIEARWGLKKCEMIIAQLKSARNSIAFIERTYLKRDPAYAALTMERQEEMIRRLLEEWNKSECRAPEFPRKAPPQKERKKR